MMSEEKNIENHVGNAEDLMKEDAATMENEQQNNQSSQDAETDNSDHTEKKSKKKKSFMGSKNSTSEEIEKLKNELALMTDKHLRMVAEFDNYKKRTLKEKSDLLRYGGETVLQNILPVLDDLERAEKSLMVSPDIEAVKQGLELVLNKFKEFIQQQGLKEIEAVNLDFNTDYHEAITRFPAPTEEMKGKVIDVVQKGYLLYDKVMRYAKVVVGE
jgi:molecular chaperone GrpE